MWSIRQELKQSVRMLVISVMAVVCIEECGPGLDYISCPLYITMIGVVKTAITQIVDLIDTDCADTIS